MVVLRPPNLSKRIARGAKVRKKKIPNFARYQNLEFYFSDRLKHDVRYSFAYIGCHEVVGVVYITKGVTF